MADAIRAVPGWAKTIIICILVFFVIGLGNRALSQLDSKLSDHDLRMSAQERMTAEIKGKLDQMVETQQETNRILRLLLRH